MIIEPSCGQQPTANGQRPEAAATIYLCPLSEMTGARDRENESEGGREREMWEMWVIAEKKTKLKVTNRGWHPSNCSSRYMKAESARLADTQCSTICIGLRCVIKWKLMGNSLNTCQFIKDLLQTEDLLQSGVDKIYS